MLKAAKQLQLTSYCPLLRSLIISCASTHGNKIQGVYDHTIVVSTLSFVVIHTTHLLTAVLTMMYFSRWTKLSYGFRAAIPEHNAQRRRDARIEHVI